MAASMNSESNDKASSRLVTKQLQRRKPWGDGGTRPPRIWSGGTPMYNVPQILTFSLYFSLT